MRGQFDTPAGSAFASACAGNFISGAGNPGNSVMYSYSGTGTCFESASTTIASVDTGVVGGVSASGKAYSGSANANATIGSLKMEATNSGSFQTAFSGGMATVGWNDTVTITGGAGSGLWVLPILVHGELHAHGVGALSRLQVGVYRNRNTLTAGSNSTAYNMFLALTQERNGDILYSWDYQMAAFGVSDADPLTSAADELLLFNQVVNFVVPFTYDTPFALGIWADAHASEWASGGEHIPNTSSFDLGNTITWNGKGYVTDSNGLNQSSGFTVSSGSGFNYNEAVVPEPSTIGLVATGAALLLLKRRS